MSSIGPVVLEEMFENVDGRPTDSVSHSLKKGQSSGQKKGTFDA